MVLLQVGATSIPRDFSMNDPSSCLSVYTICSNTHNLDHLTWGYNIRLKYPSEELGRTSKLMDPENHEPQIGNFMSSRSYINRLKTAQIRGTPLSNNVLHYLSVSSFCCILELCFEEIIW